MVFRWPCTSMPCDRNQCFVRLKWLNSTFTDTMSMCGKPLFLKNKGLLCSFIFMHTKTKMILKDAHRHWSKYLVYQKKNVQSFIFCEKKPFHISIYTEYQRLWMFFDDFKESVNSLFCPAHGCTNSRFIIAELQNPRTREHVFLGQCDGHALSAGPVRSKGWVQDLHAVGADWFLQPLTWQLSQS